MGSLSVENLVMMLKMVVAMVMVIKDGRVSVAGGCGARRGKGVEWQKMMAA